MALCTTAQYDGYYKFVQKLKNIREFVIFENHLTILGRMMEEGRSMTTFYYNPVNHQSGLQRNTFSKLSYFFNTSKCVANYVISFEVYDGFIGQKILKLRRQESQPFGPG